jgi:hypothetical protein
VPAGNSRPHSGQRTGAPNGSPAARGVPGSDERS